MDYRELRLQRVKALIQKRFGNKQREFADAVEIDPTQVSRFLMDPGKKGHASIGEDLARKIEVHLHLPPGYLVMPELDSQAELPTINGSWPFKTLPQERFDALSKDERLQVEGALRTAIADMEQSEASTKVKRRKPTKL